MNTLLWLIPCCIALLAAIALILSLLSRRSRIRRSEAVFHREGCAPTRKIGDLWLDEPHRRWTIARDCAELTLHRYSDVSSFELIEDGEKSIVRRGVVETYLGGVVLGAVLTAADRGNRQKVRAIQSMVINVYLSDRRCPVETLVLRNSPVRVGSAQYRRLRRQAEELMAAFDRMNPAASPDEETPGGR